MLENSHKYFSSIMLNITQNRYFRAQLLQVPVSETTNNFLNARRFIKLDAAEPTGPGQVIKPYKILPPTLWLTAERGTAMYQDRPIFKTLRLYEVTDHVSLSRIPTANNPITGKPTSSGTSEVVATIYCAIEPSVLEEGQMDTQTKVVRIITNYADIHLNDVIANTYKVTDFNFEGGLNIITALKL